MPKLRRFSKLAGIVTLFLGTLIPSFAASPYAGFYTGLIYISYSGTINQAETSTGADAFTVDSNGNITDGNSLNGTVNGTGTITWQTPNPLYLTTGTITSGTINSTGSTTSGGLTTTYRVQASMSGGGFGTGGALASSLNWRNPKPVSLPVNSTWNQVTYANGQFVAVGAFGAVATSTDGRNWFFRSTPTTKTLNDVDYGAGVWVAVGDDQTAISSPDGITWTLRTLTAGFFAARGVAYGNGKFVVVNSAGTVYTSTDGATWTSPGSGSPTGGIDYVNNLFIAFGSSGSFRTSTDGTSWNPGQTAGGTILGALFNGGKYFLATSTGIYQFTATDGSGAINLNVGFNASSKIAFGNNQFVVGNTLETISYSANATNWFPVNKLQSKPKGIAFGNNTFVAVGDAIEISSAGVIWTNLSYSSIGIDVRDVYTTSSQTYNTFAPFNAALFNPGIRVGDGGLIETNNALNSTTVPAPSPTSEDLLGIAINGTTQIAAAVGRKGTIISTYTGSLLPLRWTNQVSGTTADLRSIVNASFPLVFTAVGSGGVIRRSTNAVTWVNVNSGVGTTLNKVFYAELGASSRYVAAGDEGTVITSPDGITWTTRNTGVTNRIVTGLGFLSKMIVLATEDAMILRSTDAGTNWTTIKLGSPYKARSMAAWESSGFGSMRVVGEGGLAMTSGDGTNWSYTLNFSRPNVSALTHGNGRFVAATSSGYAYSTDTATWQPAANVSVAQAGVTYGKGLFVGVGTSGGVTVAQTSTDGSKWKPQTLPAAVNLQKVTYANGQFVAVGLGAAVMSSVDATNWVTRTIPGGDLRDVAYGAGKFVAIGNSATRYSSDGTNWTANTGPIDAYGITFATNLFVCVGLNGAIRTSPDGVAWTARTSNTNALLYAVGYANGKFIAAAFGGGFVTSSDGTNWTREISNIGATITAFATGNGNLLIGGESGSILQAPIPDQGSPSITGQPTANQTLTAGQALTLQVTATGSSTLRYQWLKDGNALTDGGPVSGATTATLTITGINVVGAGSYSVAVYNDYGSRLSSSAVVTVNGPPIITALTPLTTIIALNGSTNFFVTAAGPGPFTYQWRKNNQNISDGGTFVGTTSNQFSVINAQATNDASYVVVVGNSFGSVTSSIVTLGVNRGPTITVQPQATLIVNQGQTITLSVTVDGTAPLIYQWRNNSVNLTNNGSISGATSNVLTITGAAVTNSGLYTVFVTNAFGNATSGSAAVTVIGPGGFRPEFGLTNAGQVNAILPMDNGEYLVAGALVPRRITVTGATSSVPFTVTNISGTVASLARQPNGQIVLGGSMSIVYNGTTYPYLARLNSNGTFDPSLVLTAPQRIVAKAAVQQDGKILVGATSLGFAAADMRRYNADGSLDGTYTTTTFNFQLYDLAPLDDGRILAGGLFTQTSGQGYSLLSLINTNGTPNSGFGAGFNSAVIKLFVAPDGKIYVSDNNFNFVRDNANGTLDNTFSCTVNGQVNAMAFLTNGNTVIAGSFQKVGAVTNSYLALLDTNGVLLSSFVSPYTFSAANALYAIQMLPDGSALVGGNVQISSHVTQRFIQRVQIYSPDFFINVSPVSQKVNRYGSVTFSVQAGGNAAVSYQWRKNGNNISGATGASYTIPTVVDGDAGTYDVFVSNSFGNGYSQGATLTVLGDVSIVMQPVSLVVTQGFGASFSVTAAGATPFTYQWRKNGTNIIGATNSTLVFGSALVSDAASYDVLVANPLNVEVSDLASLSVVGSSTPLGTPGTIDTRFTPGPFTSSAPYVYGLSTDSTGRVLVTGNFVTYNGQARTYFMRLNSDLSLDSTSITLNNASYPQAVLPNDGFILGGYFTTVNGFTQPGFSLFNSAGTRLASQTQLSSGNVDGGGTKGGFFVQPDGKILMGGSFNSFNEAFRFNFARLNSDGSLDTSFVPASNPNNALTAVAREPGGKILVGGYFTAVGARSGIGLARYNSDGSVDTTFTNVVGSTSLPISGFAFQGDGKTVVYGNFTTFDGLTRYGIARLNTDGSMDTAYNANLSVSGKVYDVLVDPDDKLVIVGTFSTVNGTARGRIARLNTDGSLDTSFATGAGAAISPGTPSIYSIVRLADGNYLAGGAFNTFDGQARTNLVKIFGPPLPPPARAITRQPQDVTTLPGEHVEFSVGAVGQAPLSFQWRKGGDPIENQTNAVLSFGSVQGDDAGSYDVVVTDANGNTTSSPVTLTVGTYLSFSQWIADKGLTAGVNDGPFDDADGDGYKNICEYLFGTHPNLVGDKPVITEYTVPEVTGTYAEAQVAIINNFTGIEVSVVAATDVKFTSLVGTYVTEEDLGPGMRRVTIRATSPLSTTKKIFIKFIITVTE